ncbi:hypothetical protein ACSSS7_007807 [Eimeria intestinalis]
MENDEAGVKEQQNAHVEDPPQAPQEGGEEKAKKKKRSKKEKEKEKEPAVAAGGAVGDEGGAPFPLEEAAGAPPKGGASSADVRPKRKKKKKEGGGVVIIDNPEDHVQRSGSTKAETNRKSTLLLCDNSAAVALGNLVAIQRKMSSRGEADETAEAAKFFEEFEEEDPRDLAEKVAAAEERLVSLKEELLACTFEDPERYFNKLQEITKEEEIMVGEALEEEVLAIEQKEAQDNMAAYADRQKELQVHQQRLLLYEQVV